MSLSMHQERVARDWMRQKVHNPNCCFCAGTANWEPWELLDIPVTKTQSTETMLAVRCGRCGSVIFFEAKRVGLP
jgi:hypothetical protein